MFITHESAISRGIAQDQTLNWQPLVEEVRLPGISPDLPYKSLHIGPTGRLYLGLENGLQITAPEGHTYLQLRGPVYLGGAHADTLYYACENDLGYLIHASEGNPETKSFDNLLLRAYRPFMPEQLVNFENAAFIRTGSGIFRFADEHLELVEEDTGVSALIIRNDELLLLDKSGNSRIWSGEAFGESNRYFDLFPKGFVPFSFLPGNHCLGYSDQHGIEIIDEQGKLISRPGLETGLPGTGIIQTQQTADGEIYILGPHSLHHLRYNPVLSVMSLFPREHGRVMNIRLIQDDLILFTEKGVYRIPDAENPEGSRVLTSLNKEHPGSYHLADAFGNFGFAGGSHYLLRIGEEEEEIIDEGSFTGMLALNQDHVLSSGSHGLCLHEKKQEGWTRKCLDEDLDQARAFISRGERVFFIDDNKVWEYHKGEIKSLRVIDQDQAYLQKVLFFKTEVFLNTDKGEFRLKGEENEFVPIENEDHLRLIAESERIMEDGKGGHWVSWPSGHAEEGIGYYPMGSSSYERLQRFPVLDELSPFEGLSCDGNWLYVASASRLYLFHRSEVPTKQLQGRLILEKLEGYRANSKLSFRVRGLDLHNPGVEFRYKLEPGPGSWTSWKKERVLHFERLRHGHYTLEAQARDLLGRKSEIHQLEFSVHPPFYLSWYAYIVYGLAFIFLLFLIIKLRMLSYRKAESSVKQRMQRTLDKLTSEKEKSDKLVADILPERTAAQLKSEGKSKWDKYDRATVLFSDIQGFTKIAEEMNPEALIDELDQFFFHFDSVVEKYNIEKIKTIGDAYMAAGGIPEKNSTNPVEVVLAALEMQAYMQDLKAKKAEIWDLRIGIHTGPVIAGVIGHKKVSYDIWGDTVNTASRMESSGLPGKVNISGITYGMVKEYFICEYRGKLPVKYKGNIDMYFVTGLRPELSVDLKGIPNKRFFSKLQLLRLGDLEDRVFGQILNDLPERLHFHNPDYIRKVYNQSFLLSRAEEIEQDERLLVRTAALMLYTGLTQTYFNFENRSAVLAREILPAFKYSERQIDQISNLILSTKQPFQPNNRLEKILIDARMEYIGRPDYPDMAQLLLKEMRESGASINGQQFKKQQVEMLYEFEFFTVAAGRLREVSGEEQLTSLESTRWI